MKRQGTIALGLTLWISGCGGLGGTGSVNPPALSSDSVAAGYAPLAIASADALEPDPPPAVGSRVDHDELAELVRWQGQRTDSTLATIHRWNDDPAPVVWSEVTDGMLIDAHVVPPRAARALAIVHAAMFDAMVAAWKAKIHYRRAAPASRDVAVHPVIGEALVGAYPSEHAAIAGAAASALAYLFPDQHDSLMAKAREAAETRIAAGANSRSDIEAGLTLGEKVAAEIVARSRIDGSDQAATESIASDSTHWGNPAAMEPHAGSWKTWILTGGSQFRLASASVPTELSEQLAEVNREVDSLSVYPWKLAQAQYWNFDVPAIIWNKRAHQLIRTHRLSTPEAARVLGVLAAIEADTFIACWDTKYVVLRPRPKDLDPTLPARMPFATPPHPSYPSGHSAASMAAATYLGSVFPDDARHMADEANEAGMSRIYAGIHYRSDNLDGLGLGRAVASYAMDALKAKGTL